MKKWFITLLFVFACLPVVVVKAAPPQAYNHLDYKIYVGYYDIGDGSYDDSDAWRCSNKIQIPKNVGKLYFSGWLTHFILFFDDETYIGHYYDKEYVHDLSWTVEAEEKILDYYYSGDLFINRLDVPTNATHIVLQSCVDPQAQGLEDYIDLHPYYFLSGLKPLIYYPAPTDAATNMTFGLMPALMIMIVIAGLVGGLIMITKKSKR